MAKRFVYTLESRAVPARYDTGVTADVDARLAAHNLAAPHQFPAKSAIRLIVIKEDRNHRRVKVTL